MVYKLDVYKQFTDQSLDCKVNTQIEINGWTLKAIISYNLAEGKGVISIDGEGINKGLDKISIQRKILLAYELESNILTMRNNHIMSSESDYSKEIIESRNLFPEFYLFPKKDIRILIIPQGRNYVMKTDSIFPSFYCYQTL